MKHYVSFSWLTYIFNPWFLHFARGAIRGWVSCSGTGDMGHGAGSVRTTNLEVPGAPSLFRAAPSPRDHLPQWWWSKVWWSVLCSGCTGPLKTLNTCTCWWRPVWEESCGPYWETGAHLTPLLLESRRMLLHRLDCALCFSGARLRTPPPGSTQAVWSWPSPTCTPKASFTETWNLRTSSWTAADTPNWWTRVNSSNTFSIYI